MSACLRAFDARTPRTAFIARLRWERQAGRQVSATSQQADDSKHVEREKETPKSVANSHASPSLTPPHPPPSHRKEEDEERGEERRAGGQNPVYRILFVAFGTPKQGPKRGQTRPSEPTKS